MGTQLDKLHPLKSLPPALSTTLKHRLQISKLPMGKKKLHVSNGRQTLRSRLTILLLQQNLVHGDLLHYPFLFSILTTSLQAGGFVRLLRWAFGTHVRSAPMYFIKLPGSRMPWEPSAYCLRQPPNISSGRRRSLLASLSMPSPRCQTFLVFHRELFFCGTQLLDRPYPRPRIYTRAHIRKSFWPPSTPKLKLPTIRLKL
jgi:hypothetical protein